MKHFYTNNVCKIDRYFLIALIALNNYKQLKIQYILDWIVGVLSFGGKIALMLVELRQELGCKPRPPLGGLMKVEDQFCWVNEGTFHEDGHATTCADATFAVAAVNFEAVNKNFVIDLQICLSYAGDVSEKLRRLRKRWSKIVHNTLINYSLSLKQWVGLKIAFRRHLNARLY